MEGGGSACPVAVLFESPQIGDMRGMFSIWTYSGNHGSLCVQDECLPWKLDLTRPLGGKIHGYLVLW